jgi:FKBP-type peptidyl-prolyl cis-trans isomerase
LSTGAAGRLRDISRESVRPFCIWDAAMMRDVEKFVSRDPLAGRFGMWDKNALSKGQAMKRLAAAAFVMAAMFATAALADDAALSDAANQTFLQQNAHKPGMIVRSDGLQYMEVRPGKGNHPAPTDEVDVLYVGRLINGTVFDRTPLDTPRTFRVYQVIPGWTEALTLMRPGAQWRVVIPASLAYGENGTGNGLIPPNQTLVFDMELVAIHPSQD